ncbi:MAG: hypothetical protein ABF335_01385 [Alphaproteobacteria bacterium]
MTAIRNILTVLALTGMLALSACGKPSKADIVSKAEDASTRTELEAALGKPDSVSKFGFVETWTYEAEDGTVKFDLTGDSVVLKRTGNAADEEK